MRCVTDIPDTKHVSDVPDLLHISDRPDIMHVSDRPDVLEYERQGDLKKRGQNHHGMSRMTPRPKGGD